MKLVIRIGDYGGDDIVTYHTAEKFPLTLGRGYANDIILPDPHVSARHAEIVHDGAGWVLFDIGQENAIHHNGAPLHNRQMRLKSGDEFMLGLTPVAVFDPHHPVIATEKVEHTHPVIAHLSSGMMPWVYFLLAVLFTVLSDYIEYWSENTAAQMTKAAGGAALCLLLWAVPWAVTGRLSRHRSAYVAHIALASVFLLISLPVWALLDLTAFLTSENLFSDALFIIGNAAILGGLVYASLGVATHMTARRRAFASGFFTAGLMAVIVGFSYLDQMNFYPQPVYGTIIEPYLQNLPPARDIDSFMAEAETLFAGNKK